MPFFPSFCCVFASFTLMEFIHYFDLYRQNRQSDGIFSSLYFNELNWMSDAQWPKISQTVLCTIQPTYRELLTKSKMVKINATKRRERKKKLLWISAILLIQWNWTERVFIKCTVLSWASLSTHVHFPQTLSATEHKHIRNILLG